MDDDTPDMASVWTIVDRELHRRRLKWAELGRHLGLKEETLHQTLLNWKQRRIPPDRYVGIAAFLGWSVERLTGHAPEPAAPAPPPVPEPVYTRRANDIARMFDELRDPAVRQRAYALVTAQLQMAKAGQRLPDSPEPPEPEPPSPTPTTHRPEPAPRKKLPRAQ